MQIYKPRRNFSAKKGLERATYNRETKTTIGKIVKQRESRGQYRAPRAATYSYRRNDADTCSIARGKADLC